MREVVAVAAGTGINGGDWNWQSPTAYMRRKVMRWERTWAAGTYEAGDVVRDDDYTLIANKTTTAKPQTAGTVSVDWDVVDQPTPVNVALTSYIDAPQKFSQENIHGSLVLLSDGDTLSTGVPIAIDKGYGKILIVVNAGTDLSGSITVSGTSIDRETGATTPADTETITVDAVTTDNSTTDANGNPIYDFVGAYLTSKWWGVGTSIETTDLDLTDVDIYGISFEQFNDTDTTVQTLDISCQTNNNNAEGAWHLYSVKASGGKTDLQSFADIVMDMTGLSASTNLWRLRRGDLGEELVGASDGVFLQQFLGPTNQTHFEDVTIKIWGEQ